MRKIILILTILILVSGCSYKLVNSDELNKKEIDDLFNKKQECASYKEMLDERIAEEKKELSSNWGIWIDKIFYSPKMNSCLYIKREVYNNFSIGTHHQSFYLIDYLQNEVIIEDNFRKMDNTEDKEITMKKISDWENNFLEKVNKYK